MIRAARERGAATVVTTALAAFLMILGTALGAAVGLFAAHRAAQSAADLAAVSAAAAVARGQDGCAVAASIAAANDAELSDCQLTGSVVDVRVGVSGPSWMGRDPVLEAEARAGPVGLAN